MYKGDQCADFEVSEMPATQSQKYIKGKIGKIGKKRGRSVRKNARKVRSRGKVSNESERKSRKYE